MHEDTKQILEIITDMQERMATKEDLKAFATKEDLNGLRLEVAGYYGMTDSRLSAIEDGIANIRGFSKEIDDVRGRVNVIEDKLDIPRPVLS